MSPRMHSTHQHEPTPGRSDLGQAIPDAPRMDMGTSMSLVAPSASGNNTILQVELVFKLSDQHLLYRRAREANLPQREAESLETPVARRLFHLLFAANPAIQPCEHYGVAMREPFFTEYFSDRGREYQVALTMWFTLLDERRLRAVADRAILDHGQGVRLEDIDAGQAPLSERLAEAMVHSNPKTPCFLDFGVEFVRQECRDLTEYRITPAPEEPMPSVVLEDENAAKRIAHYRKSTDSTDLALVAAYIQMRQESLGSLIDELSKHSLVEDFGRGDAASDEMTWLHDSMRIIVEGASSEGVSPQALEVVLSLRDKALTYLLGSHQTLDELRKTGVQALIAAYKDSRS